MNAGCTYEKACFIVTFRLSRALKRECGTIERHDRFKRSSCIGDSKKDLTYYAGCGVPSRVCRLSARTQLSVTPLTSERRLVLIHSIDTLCSQSDLETKTIIMFCLRAQAVLRNSAQPAVSTAEITRASRQRPGEASRSVSPRASCDQFVFDARVDRTCVQFPTSYTEQRAGTDKMSYSVIGLLSRNSR
ncbi:hypothetical protein EVAR_64245_1 [Eumeta japonica]|uniref:Uncharacterized protein n=1 Tax=Eumeta variegata TaxID=151549 RepID=A0A4C1ZD38_EUMVA|nr:hypothetical protein EVAR_64245_1 [Eumeta japonica]